MIRVFAFKEMASGRKFELSGDSGETLAGLIMAGRDGVCAEQPEFADAAVEKLGEIDLDIERYVHPKFGAR